ncbi:Ubiquitin-conjugating enzyme E2Q-like protein [Blattella germanica]|nr:Ubiquitin-conjugating enzyme E2Q-like protein [Blattella germanica]
MSSRSKEKMAAAFRKLFRSSQKIGDPEGAVGGQGCSGGSGSPARRLLSRHGYHRDAVIPAEGNHGLDVPAPSNSGRKSVADLFKSKKSSSASSSSTSDKQAVMSGASAASQRTVRSRRLMKELREIQRIQQQYRHDPVFTVELVNDNLFEWHVRLYRIDSESELATDMRDMGIPYILLHIVFPDNFPFAPPFMRVISPRIEKGFVMEGGAICMELLTPRGWASAYTVEAVVMQFAASIVKGQSGPKVAISKAAPSEANLRKLEKKTFSTGSVLDTKRNGRPKNIATMMSVID